MLRHVPLPCLVGSYALLFVQPGATRGQDLDPRDAFWSVARPAALERESGCTPDEPLAWERFHVIPSFAENLRACTVGVYSEETQASPQRFLAQCGVDWPVGSTARLEAAAADLLVRNTPANLDRVRGLLAAMLAVPHYLEIEVHYVAFPADTVARLGPDGVETDSLLCLWTNGQARVLASPRCLTSPGTSSSVSGVTECRYPVDFTVRTCTPTNRPSPGSAFAIAPRAFDMRETGTALTVGYDPPGPWETRTWIESHVDSAPVWVERDSTYTDTEGEPRHLSVAQPSFRLCSFDTHVHIANGQRMLVGGGLPTPDGRECVYVFARARLLGVDGRPLMPCAPLMPEKAP